MPLDEIEFLANSNVLRQDSHTPTRLSEDSFQATPPQVELLTFGGPGIDSGTELDQPAIPKCAGVASDSLRCVGIYKGVAKSKWVFARLFERGMHPEDGAGAAIDAVVGALGADIDRMGAEALLLELGGSGNTCFEVDPVNSHNIPVGGLLLAGLFTMPHSGESCGDSPGEESGWIQLAAPLQHSESPQIICLQT